MWLQIEALPPLPTIISVLFFACICFSIATIISTAFANSIFFPAESVATIPLMASSNEVKYLLVKSETDVGIGMKVYFKKTAAKVINSFFRSHVAATHFYVDTRQKTTVYSLINF